MALDPIDEAHALQIQAGALGRKRGHIFEDTITEKINALEYPLAFSDGPSHHILRGDPALNLLHYIASTIGVDTIERAMAISTGALATSEEGKKWLNINGANVSRCKSDLVITLVVNGGEEHSIGVSTKQCNNSTPTNAQLYFTTARGFSNLLNENGIAVSDVAIRALRQFCGDVGFRPLDFPDEFADRACDPRRFFWEEIDQDGRNEWEKILSEKQDEVTRLMLQKAYIDDPFIPEVLLHKTKKAESWETTEVAIYTIDEIIAHSRAYGGYRTKSYSVRKGGYKDPPGVSHDAPRFGIVQMQRGGQKQHPDQLQFNLEAGYFYKIENRRP